MDKTTYIYEIWMALKPFGLYQLGVLIYLTFNMFPSVNLVLNYVIIGHVPKHTCKDILDPLSHYGVNTSSNISDFYIEYKECETQLYHNHSNGTNTAKYTISCQDGYSYDTSVRKSLISEWNLICDKEGLGELGQLLVMAGQLVGATAFSFLADRYGRKPVFVSTNVLLFVLSLSLSFVPSFVMFAVLRFIRGALQEGMNLSLRILILEMFPQQYRGRIAVIHQYCWTAFVVILSGIGYFMRSLSLRYVQIVTTLISIQSLASYWITDESLRWLMANKRFDNVVVLVNKIAKGNNVSFEHLNLLMSSRISDGTYNGDNNDAAEKVQSNDILERFSKRLTIGKDNKRKSSTKNNTFIDIVKHRILLKYSLIMWFIWIVNSLTYYGLYLISTPLTGNRFLDFFLNGLAELPAAILYMLLIDRIGRRKSSIVLHTMTGVSIIISTLVYTYKGQSQSLHTVSVIFNYIGKTGISASSALVYLYTPEMYPTTLRQVFETKFGISEASYVPWGPGIVFGVCCIIAVLLTLFLPKTKDRELPQTVEEIDNWHDVENTKKLSLSRKREYTELK